MLTSRNTEGDGAALGHLSSLVAGGIRAAGLLVCRLAFFLLSG